MTWEGRRCGGFVTTQIQGQEGNWLKQAQKPSNQAKQIIFHQNQKETKELFFMLSAKTEPEH